MGLNQAPLLKKKFYHVKVKSLEVASLQELGQLMDQLQCQALHVKLCTRPMGRFGI